MNVINATRDWDAWAATVDDFNREIDHNPDLVPPIKLLAPALPRPSDDDWCASIDRIMQSGCLRGTHPLWLWLPLVDAFAWLSRPVVLPRGIAGAIEDVWLKIAPRANEKR